MRVWLGAAAFGVVFSACSADPDLPDDALDAGNDDAAVDAPAKDVVDATLDVPGDAPAGIKAWVVAYYPGYKATDLPPSELDFSSMTHVVYSAIVPKPDGSLDLAANNLKPEVAKELVQLAHAAGRKALVSIGGAVPKGAFESAASPANRATLIQNLIDYIQSNGFDGLDLDWEPIPDVAVYQAFVPELDAALAAKNPAWLLTCASPGPASTLVPVAKYYDQLNVMTYDVSGPYSDWVTWFNSPISAGDLKFPKTGGAVPAIDSILEKYTAAGVPASKLGIGAPFYGYIWTGGAGTPTGGVSAPRQSWTTAPKTTRNGYRRLMTDYAGQTKQWDAVAKVPYFSIDKAGSADDQFVSFDDEQAMTEKANFIKQKGYGGVIVWELEQGYFPANAKGAKHPLLKALALGLGI